MIEITSAKSAKRSVLQEFESASLWCHLPSETLKLPLGEVLLVGNS